MPEATLAEKYMPFARKLARSLTSRLPAAYPDDLEGDAFLGLVKAQKRFDATRGVSFGSFAAPFILGAMLDGIRKECRKVKTVSLNTRANWKKEFSGGPDFHDEWLEDRNAEDPATIAELRDEVRFVLENLGTEKHSRPGSPRLSVKAIAEEAGITSGGASQRISRARRIMDEMLREAAANN